MHVRTYVWESRNWRRQHVWHMPMYVAMYVCMYGDHVIEDDNMCCICRCMYVCIFACMYECMGVTSWAYAGIREQWRIPTASVLWFPFPGFGKVSHLWWFIVKQCVVKILLSPGPDHAHTFCSSKSGFIDKRVSWTWLPYVYVTVTRLCDCHTSMWLSHTYVTVTRLYVDHKHRDLHITGLRPFLWLRIVVFQHKKTAAGMHMHVYIYVYSMHLALHTHTYILWIFNRCSLARQVAR
jgi:hypothetical protein